jgi:glutaminyl-tRNA synthetase
MENTLNFIEQIVENDLSTHKYGDKTVHTRFPPEPNGYLHIGHAKSICLNFGLAQKYGGSTNLRLDDTNPTTEDTEYVASIKNDVAWLGFDWAGNKELYASDYFGQIYAYAYNLIERGRAYVDFSTSDEIAAQKGNLTQPGTENKYRNTPIAENLALFEQMKDGKFDDGTCVLRAKIDMTSPNLIMRDPVIYRIKRAHHHRTANDWCIYPMYDFAHCISDSIEGITHSICTLEFEVHRPLYDWILEALEVYRPQQIEFARLNLTYTVMSKRKLLQLVTEKHVNGWDDPRMPTISGLRRRGYTPGSIREFAHRVGVAKRDNMIDLGLLEFCIREDLNKTAHRAMAVLDPLKLTITNYPAQSTEWLTAENNPENPADGVRQVPFSNEIFVESDDFMENPSKKYFRLAVGQIVRLKNAYIIQCNEAIKDANGKVIELKCTYIENSKSGSDTSGINVKGTIHWVSAAHALPAEVRLYDRLFTTENPTESKDTDFKTLINSESVQIITALVEPSLSTATPANRLQFMRKGYFCVDLDSTTQKLIFNRTVTLKDTWAKIAN